MTILYKAKKGHFFGVVTPAKKERRKRKGICNPEGGNQEFKLINLENLVAIAAKS